MPRLVPRSAWNRFLAIVLSGLLLLVVASYDTISIEHEPIYSWPEGRAAGIGFGETQASFQIEPDEVDLKSDTLRSLHFYVEFFAADRLPFSAYLFWPSRQWTSLQGSPIRNSNGTLDWTQPARIAVWELTTRPEKGAEPFGWRLGREGSYPWNGEYPWEQYSLVFVFGFNRTMNLASLASTVWLRTGLQDEWKVTQTLHRVETSLIDALSPLGFSSDDLERLSFRNFAEAYELRIGFVRQTSEVLRGLLAFWMPSLLLGALLMLAWMRKRFFQTSEALTLFMGTGLATLPFIVGALQALPPRLNAVEMLFYLEIAFSIVLAAWTIASTR